MKAILILLALTGMTNAVTGANLELGSRSTQTVISGSSGSFSPASSADGRFAAFVSQARNLVANDRHDPLLQVYRRDLASGSTELVSVNSTGGGANESAFAPSG